MSHLAGLFSPLFTKLYQLKYYGFDQWTFCFQIAAGIPAVVLILAVLSNTSSFLLAISIVLNRKTLFLGRVDSYYAFFVSVSMFCVSFGILLHRRIKLGDESLGCRLQASLLQLGWTAAPLWALLSAHGVLARLCDIRRRNRHLSAQNMQRAKFADEGARDGGREPSVPLPYPIECPKACGCRAMQLTVEALCSSGADPGFPLVEDDYGAGETELSLDFCAFNARRRLVVYHGIAWGVALVYAAVAGGVFAGPDSTGTFLWCWVPHERPGARTALFMAPQSVIMGLLVVVAAVLGCGFSGQERATIDFGRRLVPWATCVFALVQLLWIVATILGEEGVGTPAATAPTGVSRFMNDFKACLTASEGLLVTVVLASAVFVADQRAAVRAWLPVLADLAEGKVSWDEEEDEGDEEGAGGEDAEEHLEDGSSEGSEGREAVERQEGVGLGPPSRRQQQHNRQMLQHGTSSSQLLGAEDRAAMAEVVAAARRDQVGGGGTAKTGGKSAGPAPVPALAQGQHVAGDSRAAARSARTEPRPGRVSSGTMNGLGVRVRSHRVSDSGSRSGSLGPAAAASLVAAAEEQRNPYDCAGLSRPAWWAGAVALGLLSFHHTLNLWTAERSGGQHDVSELAVDAFSPPLLQGIRAGLAALQLGLVAAVVRGCTLTRFQGYWRWVVQLGEDTARDARRAVQEEEDYCLGIDVGAGRPGRVGMQARGQRDRRRVSEPPPRLRGKLLQLAVMAASEAPTPCYDPFRCFSVPSGELVGAIASRLARIVGSAGLPHSVAGSSPATLAYHSGRGRSGAGGGQWSIGSLGTGDTSSSSALLPADSLAGASGGGEGSITAPSSGLGVSPATRRTAGVDDALRMVLEGGGVEGAFPTLASPEGMRGRGRRPGRSAAASGSRGYGEVARALAARRFAGDATAGASPWIKATQHGDRMPWCQPCDQCVVLAAEGGLAPDHRLVRFRDVPLLPVSAIFGPGRTASGGLVGPSTAGGPAGALYTSQSAGRPVTWSGSVGTPQLRLERRSRGGSNFAESRQGLLATTDDEDECECCGKWVSFSPELCWRATYQETRLTFPCAFMLRALLVGVLVVHAPILLTMSGIQMLPDDMAVVFPLAAATQPLITFVGQVLLCGDTHTLSLSSALGPLILALVASGTLLLQVLGVEVPSPGGKPQPHPVNGTRGGSEETSPFHVDWSGSLGQSSSAGSPQSLETAAGFAIAATILPAMGALLFAQSFTNPFDRREGVSMRAPAASHVPKAVAILGTGSLLLLLASCLGELGRSVAGIPYSDFNWGLRVPHGPHAPTLWATEMAASSRQALAVLLTVVLLDTAGPIRFGMIWNIVPFGLAVAAAVSPDTPAPSLGNGVVQVVGMVAMVWALVMDSFLEGKCCPAWAANGCRRVICGLCCPACVEQGAPCAVGPGSSREDVLEELRDRLRGLDEASAAASSGSVRLMLSRPMEGRSGRRRAGSTGGAGGRRIGRRSMAVASSRGSASGVIEGVYRSVEARAAGVTLAPVPG